MRVKIVTSAVLSQTRFIKRILTVDIRLVSFIPIQRLDNNRNACMNLIQYTCLTSVKNVLKSFLNVYFTGGASYLRLKKMFRCRKMVSVVGVPKVKDG